MIRELFHELGEQAIEALRALAETQQDAAKRGPSIPPYSLIDHLAGVLGILAESFGDKTLRVERIEHLQAIRISHRCSLCKKRHSSLVDEPMFMGAPDARSFVHQMVYEVEMLLQRPCNVELGSATR